MTRLGMAGAVFLLIVMAAGGINYLRPADAAGSGASAKQETQPKSTAEELQGLEKRRQQLMEKEAALAAKEQELNRLAASLESRIKELNAAQKALETTLNEKKKREAEQASAKYMKMFKLLKAMRPEEAAKIMDKLDEPVAIGLLERYDQKTVLKLAKYISQPRLLKWIKENLQTGPRAIK
ncbi:hypothetical protein OR1_01974 [Geobacter sp. OR-1]|uniref:MotE family protein n=1 Tax=Geobacter sp. OR-1 TaxID=1266765 RepID=UPI000542C08A|nr:hypothetical protein [Geobacter sp. OR-1]GAM09694.1 hypothetical protein OR1_01974 [Geobacter sp. OR-1]